MEKNIIKSSKLLVEKAKKNISNISVNDGLKFFNNKNYIFIDLRDIRELKKLGKIKNAKHVPRGMLEFWLDPESPYHRTFFKLNVFFIFYCASGWRSALSTLTAQEMGLKNVLNLDGGYTKWLECNGPFEKLI